MICVTLGRGRHSTLLEEWKAAAEAGAELVEIRADCLRRDPDLKRILANRPTPLVFTLRRGVDGGLWKGTEEKRQQYLREAIVMGVDYVDLEKDIAPKIRRYGKTKRIISYHNLKGTPEELLDIAEQCDEMDADVVKIATLANSVADASRVLELGPRSVVPTITIAMGPLGFFTRVLGAKFGAPFTFAGFNPERSFAPGMVLASTLRRDYFYDQINAETEVYGVIGDPIDQSLSPVVHNSGFRHLGLNKVLVPFLIPSGTVGESLKALSWLGLKGFSVTIPHKELILGLLAKKDPVVERTGSCNTVLIEEGGWAGYNTDLPAAIDSLEKALNADEQLDPGTVFLEKTALILGAGGVSRSIAFGLEERGATVMVSNRHEEKADRLAEEVGARSIPWHLRSNNPADILINCTPVGMHPDVDDTPMPPGSFKPGMVVFDTVYHPENTMLLKLARESESRVVTGVDMFLGQAARQFKLYTGQDAPQEVMREALKRKLGPLRL